MFSAKPGDIFACYGIDAVSLGISVETSLTSWLTGPNGLRWSPSHVAIAAKSPTHDSCAWYESTMMADRMCKIARRPVNGFQCHEITDRLHDYVMLGRGRVDVYRLASIDALSDSDQHKLFRMLVSYAGTPEGKEAASYDTAGALFSGTRVLKWLPFGRSNLDTLFCSEVIAAVLQRLCLMNRDNPARYNPGLLMRQLVRQGTYHRIESLRHPETCHAS